MSGLFEFEDQRWFPEMLRKMQVEYIGWLVEKFQIYAGIASSLNDALNASGKTHITDLGSGNGGPVKFLLSTKQLKHITATLTDLFPVETETREGISQEKGAVDALNVPAHLNGFRTMFNAFHHFDEADKKHLIHKHSRHGFFVAEILQPNPIVFIKILITTTIGQLLLTPFVKPFSWKRIIFTYLIPVNILTITWDGLVSVLKSESHMKMKKRSRDLNSSDFKIIMGISGAWWARISWFYVIPFKA